MKRLALAVLVALAWAVPALADPVPPPGLRKVTHDATLTGAGTLASALGLAPCGTAGQTWIWNGSAFACGTAGGASGVTNVDTLAPLQGGPITTTGTVSLSLCAAGQVLKMNVGGTAWSCAADSGVTSGTLTANQTVKATSAGAIGNGWAVDDGTTWGVASKYTIDESTGNLHEYGSATVDGSLTAGASSSSTHTIHGSLTMTDGPLVLPTTTSAQTSGTFNNVALGGTSMVRITSTSNIAFTGIDATGRTDGSLLLVYNDSNFKTTWFNENTNSTTTNRIQTPGGASISVQAGGYSLLMYSTSASPGARWKLLAWGGAEFPTMTVDAASSFGGLATFNGNVIANGDTTIGNAAGDSLTVTATPTFSAPTTINSTLGVTGLVDLTGQSVYLGRQVLTSTTSATYTPTTGTRKVLLRMCGAGGGGGGAKAGAAGGGAGGSYVEKWINPGAAITGGSYTDGVGGSAGSATPTDGGTGGDTTITIQATTYTAKGGGKSLAAASTGAQAGGAGQAGSSAGDVSSLGMPGNMGVATTSSIGVSGNGGSSPFGTGGVGVQFSSNNVAGVAGSGYCSGGSGGAGNSGAIGGAGTQGVIIVDEWR